ncbi:hypothetical protein BgiBS90_020922 [Biomphalaria glabrata]|nr:hypothetical protein BgiBS90_020922 [Biomphalaria glabrata]
MVSQAKGGIDSLVKEKLPVDTLVKKLHGQDCGCKKVVMKTLRIGALSVTVLWASLVGMTFKTRNVATMV